jgi:hypothetical protein
MFRHTAVRQRFRNALSLRPSKEAESDVRVQLNRIKTDFKQLFPEQQHVHLIIGIPSLKGKVK